MTDTNPIKTNSGSLLKAPQVAKQLNVSLRTVRRLISTGQLAAQRIGRSVRVHPSALEALMTGAATR